MMNPEKVFHPSHYQIFPDAEVMDIIRGAMTKEEFLGFLKGNVLKYMLRAGKKGELKDDLAKADYYQQLLFSEWEGEAVSGLLETYDIHTTAYAINGELIERRMADRFYRVGEAYGPGWYVVSTEKPLGKEKEQLLWIRAMKQDGEWA